jgi:hypothetical protein
MTFNDANAVETFVYDRPHGGFLHHASGLKRGIEHA